MNKSVIALALALGLPAWGALAQDTTPSTGERPARREADSGSVGRPGRPGGFHLLPPRAAEQLNLTADQEKQIAALEKDTRAKLEKILTKEQLEQLKQMRPPMRRGNRGGMGPGGGPNGHGPHNGPPPGGPEDGQPQQD